MRKPKTFAEPASQQQSSGMKRPLPPTLLSRLDREANGSANEIVQQSSIGHSEASPLPSANTPSSTKAVHVEEDSSNAYSSSNSDSSDDEARELAARRARTLAIRQQARAESGVVQ